MNRQSWKLFPLDWALLSTAVYAAMRCLQTAYEMDVNNWILWLWVVLLTGVCCAAFRQPHAWGWALGGLLLILLGYLGFRHTLNAGLKELVRTVLATLSGAYDWLDAMLSVSSRSTGASLTPAFLLLSSVLTLFVCAAVVWLRTALPATLFCVAAIVPCFFLLDTPPQAIWLVLLTLSLLVLAFSQCVRSRAPDEAAQATLYALLPAVLILALTLLFFPEKNYEPPVQLEDLADKIVQVGEDIGGSLSTGSSTVERVDLRTLGAKQQSLREALRVRVDKQPTDNLLYLRGMAYEDFDGASWRLGTLPEGSGAVLGSYPSTLTGDTATVQIQTFAVRKVRYTPNRLAPISLGTAHDRFVPNPDRDRSYGYTIFVPGDRQLTLTVDPAVYLSQEEREACLYLPEQTRADLQAIAAQNGIQTASSVSALVVNIADHVRACAIYDLAPERVPADKDFCTWFLTEAESGYCVHFASAATALLRAVGVPARYVEGYVTTIRAGEETVVEERQAHAWVEAFIDGTGWVLVDPTPADGLTSSATPRGDGEENGGNEADDGIETEAPTQPTEATDSSDAQEQPTLPTVPEEQDNGQQTIKTPKKPLPLWVWLLLGVLALAGVHILRRVRRRQLFAKAKGKRLLMLYWRRHKLFCKALRTEPDKDCEALAKKAHFSQHAVLPEEIRLLADTVRRQESALSTLPDLRRYWYSYWLK